MNNELYLIAGLGNPGKRYEKTRHNAGFMVIDVLSQAFPIPVKTKKNFANAVFGKGFINDSRVILAKPADFMNLSGPPVYMIAKYFGIKTENVLIIHDDIDIDFGEIKLKIKGGDGGHKGIKSLIRAFGSGDFARLRIGVGRGERLGVEKDVTDHVLGKFDSNEKKNLDFILRISGDAAASFIRKGAAMTMNIFNNKNLIIQTNLIGR
jgi:PTH1 family peptidyl-tRNA hydrolase